MPASALPFRVRMSWSARRPPRLPTFDYRGVYIYFVTCCTDDRRRIFLNDEAVAPTRAEVLRTSAERGFTVTAEVWMPDHVHLLMHGTRVDSDFRATMKLARQRTAIRFRGDGRLWQDGYYEHVLLDDEAEVDFVEYMVLNPVAARLVSDPREYSFCYLSDEYREYFFGARSTFDWTAENRYSELLAQLKLRAIRPLIVPAQLKLRAT